MLLTDGCTGRTISFFFSPGSYAVNGGDSEDSPFAFPWILETLNIQAYDFSKVLESFIRAEPRLPADVVKVCASWCLVKQIY